MGQNKLQKTIQLVGLNYKKEVGKIVVIDLCFLALSLVAFVILKQWVYILLGGGLIITFTYLMISSYSSKKAKIEKERNDEFITIITYFRTFISNRKNIYQSFVSTIDYSSLWMKEKIEMFLESIDQDKSVKPYIDFANNFTLGISRNVMLSIYQMVDQGESSLQLNQFSYLFQIMSSNYHKELKDKKKKSLTNVNAFPLVGAALIVLLLSISIISIVGDLINVI